MVVFFRRFHPGKSVLCSLLAVSVCYVAALCVLEKRGFWITDNANKFLQVQALANSRYTDFSIPWPGQIVDPDFIYNPLPYYFTRVESGKLYSVFSPVFALISALFFTHVGHWGLYLLPALSSLAMLAGLAQVARLVTPRIVVAHVAVLTAGLCTPVFFYSLVFWEHTPAICLGIWSVRYLLQFLADSAPKHLCLGMAAAGLSVYFRDEFYLLCLVLALCTAFYASAGRLKILVSSALILFGCPPAALALPMADHRPSLRLSFEYAPIHCRRLGPPSRGAAAGVLQPLHSVQPDPLAIPRPHPSVRPRLCT